MVCFFLVGRLFAPELKGIDGKPRHTLRLRSLQAQDYTLQKCPRTYAKYDREKRELVIVRQVWEKEGFLFTLLIHTFNFNRCPRESVLSKETTLNIQCFINSLYILTPVPETCF